MRALLPPAFLLPAFILGIWGCLLARLWVSGDLSNLQAPRFHLLTLVAATACLLAAISAPLLFRSPNRPTSLRQLLRLLAQSLILLLPPAAYLIQGPSFSTPTALLDRAWLAANARHPASLPRTSRPDPAAIAARLASSPPDTPVPLSLLELFAIESSPSLRHAFTNRSVELLGQYLPDDPGTFRLVRLLMICCAADARPIGLVVHGPAPPLDPGGWTLAVGHLGFDHPDERVILRALHATPTDAPSDLFLY